jgi:UDPglucose--hexose-1-phosphate uridylyltransferase
MSEIRQDPTTKEWVIIAPERAKRPQHMPRTIPADELPNWDKSCPFCPGNETQTPDEVMRIPAASKDAKWDVRVVPNQFAALNMEGSPLRTEEGHLFRKMDGIGIHEVIIESPSHNIPMALMPYEQVEKILIAYQQRYNILKRNRQLKYITIFKNHGWASGTSLIHPHSQMAATPIAATYYRRKFDVAVDYYDDTGKCLYCDLINEELKKGDRIVVDAPDFIVLHPYASRVAYESWIIPKNHCATFGLFPSTKLGALSRVLKNILFYLYRGIDNPAFNFMFDTSTTEDEEDPYYHWHIRIVPRLTTIAGFEMGSGMYINTSVPEDTAQILRELRGSLIKEGILSSE